MRRVAVEHDLQPASAGREELRDKAIGVAQFGNADLGDEVEAGGFLEERRIPQVDSRTGVDDHIIEALSRHRQQFIDGFIGSLDGREFAWGREHG